MAPFQESLHKFEAGSRGWLRALTATLAGLLILLSYDLRQYRNLATEDAMDAAQLGRRIAEGKGFTTQFIRPLSLFLVGRATSKTDETAAARGADKYRLRDGHPDIANAPVYPVLLAGVMKVLPFRFVAATNQPFWSSGNRLWRYQPDFLIALFNQALFTALILLTFLWARRLFDPVVAWTSAMLLLGNELLWRFSVSGLSTMLLLVIFAGLIWCLTLLDAEIRKENTSPKALLGFAVATGLLLGVGGLTRYAFGCLMVPVLLFVIILGGPRKVLLCLVITAAFAAVMAPWIIRNLSVNSAPFGTASYAVLDGTDLFPHSRLQRSFAPSLQFITPLIWAKVLANVRTLLQNPFGDLGGWICAFFIAGLLIAVRSPAIRRMRGYLLACMAWLAIVQCFGAGHLSEDSPQINSENLLVLMLPTVVVLGVSLFFTLFDQVNLPAPGLRVAGIGAFVVAMCLPMILALYDRAIPIVYPPYHPVRIQQTCAWMKPDELMMSDIPWAVAWYGNRQCVALTLNAEPIPDNPANQENFFAISRLKTIHALYLTEKTTDARFVSDWVGTGHYGWGQFVLDAILRSEVPFDFPLREMPTGLMPVQMFLADSKRWQ